MTEYAIVKFTMNFMLSSLFLGLVLWYPVDMSKEVDVDGSGGSGYQHCLDHKGKEVSHGERFFPLGSDPCTQCTCLNGKPQMCIAVFCSPPENCRQYHALSDKCCEFVCLDRDFPSKAGGNTTYSDSDALSTTNLGLRLVASTVTSFLILALLLFMIHRLRQRRLLLMIRRFHARRMDNGNAHLSRRFSEEDDGSVGYFVGHDQLDFSRYDEPPPPYTLWKPPEMYIPPGEAPPPYDLSVQLTAPYTSSFTYHPPSAEENTQGSIQTLNTTQQQATISVHAVAEDVVPSVSNDTNPGTNCSICTAVDMELNNMANSTTGAVLPPDIQYEESCSYAASTSAVATNMSAAANSILPDVTEVGVAADRDNAAVVDSAVPSTSSCTCTLVSRKGKSKRHSCCEEISVETGTSRDAYPSTSRDNNNLYPDPTAWCGDQCESSSSSSPTYEQPTLSPSTSDSSSGDTDFRAPTGGRSFGTIPGHRDTAFESSRHRDLPEEGSKAPHFQKTLSNLKKFSLIKRKKKKRRLDRPSEISCSFVCQTVADAMPQAVFEDGIDLTVRDSMENIARPLEAINPHIGHKLASSGLRSHSRPTTISIPGQTYRQVTRRRDGSGPSFISYADVHCCGSVVTVSGGTLDCIACRNASSPDQSSRSLGRPGISRSGSICSETGERRYHRSAGSSPTTAPARFLESQYVSSSMVAGLNDRSIICGRTARSGVRDSEEDTARSRYRSGLRGSEEDSRTMRNGLLGQRQGSEEESVRGTRNGSRDSEEEEDGTVRHIPVWVVNSVAVAARHEYDGQVAMRRSASGGMGEGSRSVGDVSSPLDFRDSMLSSGSSWEACSHL